METREKGKYEFSLDNRQVGLIVSGLILVLALSFLLGTLFGRNLGQMADTGQPPAATAMAGATTAEATDLTAMPAENAASAGGGTVAPATLAGGSSDRNNLIASLESQKPSLAPSATATDPAPAAAPAAAPAPLSAPIPTAPAPKPALAPEAAAPAPAAAPIPAPKPPKPAADPAAAPTTPVAAGSYTIQIASAPSKAEGQAMVNELRAKKYDAYMLPAALPTGTFYRVRVGHYSSLDQAEKARKILQTREGKYFDAWITQ